MDYKNNKKYYFNHDLLKVIKYPVDYKYSLYEIWLGCYKICANYYLSSINKYDKLNDGYSNNDTKTNSYYSNNSSNIYSSNIYSLNIHSSNIYSSNIHSSNIYSSNIHLNNTNNTSNIYTNNLYGQVYLNNINNSNINNSNLHNQSYISNSNSNISNNISNNIIINNITDAITTGNIYHTNYIQNQENNYYKQYTLNNYSEVKLPVINNPKYFPAELKIVLNEYKLLSFSKMRHILNKYIINDADTYIILNYTPIDSANSGKSMIQDVNIIL